MKILIIRSCDRDDLKARLCCETAKKFKIADRIIFFEGNEHPEINKCGEEIIYREFCDNFGGASNVITMLSEIDKLLPKFDNNDTILFSDSDIIFLSNPFDILPIGTDHAGFYDVNYQITHGVNHVSGQLNIIKGWLWNNYIEGCEHGISQCIRKLNEHNYAIADDTIFSVFSYLNDAKQFAFKTGEAWLHHKINSQEEFNNYFCNKEKD